jgi:hypothetical protein
MPDSWPTEDIVRFADFIIRKNGYISSTKAKQDGLTSTAGYIKQALSSNASSSHEMRDVVFNFNSQTKSEVQEQKARLQPMMDWIKGISDSHPDLFLRKLKNITLLSEVREADLAILCSIFSAYSRAAEQPAHIGGEASDFVGNVGEKRSFNLTLVSQRDLNGQYGPSKVFVFKDSEGNELSWITGSEISLTVGSSYVILGTVKEHRTFRGSKQTLLTRCKIL